VLLYGEKPFVVSGFARPLELCICGFNGIVKMLARLAAVLSGIPRVERVMYPGLASHPAHLLAKTQRYGIRRMVTAASKRLDLDRNSAISGAVPGFLPGPPPPKKTKTRPITANRLKRGRRYGTQTNSYWWQAMHQARRVPLRLQRITDNSSRYCPTGLAAYPLKGVPTPTAWPTTTTGFNERAGGINASDFWSRIETRLRHRQGR